MFITGRYKIDDEFKVHNIITNEHPEGDYIYDPFEKKEVLPFWGVLCTTFWGLELANREYLIAHTTKDQLKELQFQKFWVFWFSDGNLNDQKELFFTGTTAKEHAYSVQHIFNHLLEKQVDKLLAATKKEYLDNLNFGGITPDIEEHLRSSN